MRGLISCVVAVAVAAGETTGGAGLAALALSGVLASSAAARPPAVTIETCQDLQDQDVRAKLTELTSRALTDELSALDYDALVESHWLQAHMSDKLDREVDDAVAAVRADTNWGERAYSTLSQETARKYAESVAERTYSGEGFRNALGDLAGSIGKEVGARIEQAADKIASPIIACVQNALQTRYGSAVAQVFSQETEANFRLKPEVGGARITRGDMVINTAPTIAGVALVVTRRIVGQMIAGIGRRVAGMVATRIASSLTGVIGFALIAADVYQAGDGIFPVIAERMKSGETKDIIKKEIARTISADVREQTSALSQDATERLFSYWLDFKQKYEKLLSLSDRNEKFAAFLKNLRVDQLAKLGQIASVVIASEGEDGVFRRAEDGALSRALSDLDANGLQIMNDRQSLAIALRWLDLAGRSLDKVVTAGLHKAIAPDDISAEQVRKLIQVEDRQALARLVRLDRISREALLTLPLDQVRDLARRLQPQELDALAEYQRRLPQAPARLMLRAVADDPRVMGPLAESGVRQAILDSKDQGAAVTMLASQEFLNPTRFGRDFDLVTEGRVHYWVFWRAYWVVLASGAFIALLLFLWLKRLLFGRSPRMLRARGR